MTFKSIALATVLALSPMASLAQSVEDIALAAIDAIFINPNPERIKELVSEDYIQHNPNFPNGVEVLLGFAENPPPGFKYEVGNVIVDEDKGLVAFHFRVEGFGPAPMVGVDIWRIADGKVVEHWDVLQEEVTETVSGNPMWTPAID